MFLLILLALIVAFLGFAPQKYGIQRNHSKKYILICGVLVAAFSALRSPLTGTSDNYFYTIWYLDLQQYKSFKDYYDLNLSQYDFLSSEAGYYFVMWFFGHFLKDGQWAIVISSLFITFATCRFIYRNSANVPLSLTIYVCLGLFTFNMNGMRQAMAMSVCLFAYEFARDRKLVPFILTVVIAMLFHKTAMCFLPMFIVPRLKNNVLSWFIYVVGLVLCLLYIDQIITGYYELSGEDYSDNEIATGGGLFVILLYIGTIAITVFKRQILKREVARTAMFATLVGLVSYLARFIGSGIMERISFYYFYFPLLLIPEAFEELEEHEYKVVEILFVIGAVVLFVYRVWKGDFKNFEFFFM